MNDQLDLRSLTCPMSLLRVKQFIKTLGESDSVVIEFGDNASMNDSLRYLTSRDDLVVEPLSDSEIRVIRELG